MENTSERPALYYIYDALCGWCYGFSPVMVRLFEQYSDRMDFDVISGGMIRGENVHPASEVADYIFKNYPRVEQMSGVVFGEPFLDGILVTGTAMFNSMPAALAMCVFKTMLPQRAVPYAASIQFAIHHDGMEPEDMEGYARLAVLQGVDATEFSLRLADPACVQMAEEEFSLVHAWGIQGFPALVIRHKAQLYMLANGFTPYETVVARMEEVLAR